jgi:hypothetical protein
MRARAKTASAIIVNSAGAVRLPCFVHEMLSRLQPFGSARPQIRQDITEHPTPVFPLLMSPAYLIIL